jgi:hypothetical protein
MDQFKDATEQEIPFENYFKRDFLYNKTIKTVVNSNPKTSRT